MRSILIRVGIVGAIAGGAFLLRDFLPSNAGNLAVGDCFDLPATETETVEDVQHHPCTEAHGGEVVFVGDFDPAPSAFPSDAEMFVFFSSKCITAFFEYTGLTDATSQHLDMSAFTPTQEGWGTGDRTVICYATSIDQSPMTTSLKKAP
jgi:putative regulator of septum formation